MASIASMRAKVAERKDPDPVTDAHLRQIEHDLARFYPESDVGAEEISSPPPRVMAPI